MMSARFRRHSKRAAKSLRSKRLFLQGCEVGFHLEILSFQLVAFIGQLQEEIHHTVQKGCEITSQQKVSRGWDEPNARDMGRMKSQPNAKGEMYILNDGIDMKAKIAAMARRLEELEMKKMQEVQAISQTPLQAIPCAICLSYEHLVDECPTIPAVREMFGDCNTYNSNWRNHPNFSWKP
uniref:Uncharacterized protein n=1 Tax=Vitis vinifera TaxID=29760 RepID=A5BM87_VITVI|nr:hypothetical protein VITISV_015382 [Vitis vinifera]